MRRVMFLAFALATVALQQPGWAAEPTHHRAHNHHRRSLAHLYPTRPVEPPVGAAEPDCRYPDGTPFDPEIIGGENHIGDGGPAVNLGGGDPCGY